MPKSKGGGLAVVTYHRDSAPSPPPPRPWEGGCPRNYSRQTSGMHQGSEVVLDCSRHTPGDEVVLNYSSQTSSASSKPGLA